MKVLKSLMIGLGLAVGLAAAVANPEYNMRSIEPGYDCPRAMWVWGTMDIVGNAEAEARFFEFCANRRLGTLYLYTGNQALFAEPRQGQLREFMRQAASAGISVQGLDGWCEAGTTPKNQEAFLASLDRVLEYNRTAPAEERFSGFQSDVEPHGVRTSTKEETRMVMDDYVELHRRCRRLIDAKQPENFVLGLAISAWLESSDYDKQLVRAGQERNILELLADFSDYMAIMSYRDSSVATLDIVRDEIQLGNRRGIPMWVGQETLKVDPSGITYREEGVNYMEQELAKIYRSLQYDPGFAGFAIHFYGSYVTLPDEPATPPEPPQPQS